MTREALTKVLDDSSNRETESCPRGMRLINDIRDKEPWEAVVADVTSPSKVFMHTSAVLF